MGRIFKTRSNFDGESHAGLLIGPAPSSAAATEQPPPRWARKVTLPVRGDKGGAACQQIRNNRIFLLGR